MPALENQTTVNDPIRFLLSPTFAAHVFKAVFRHHHRNERPILRRFIPSNGVVIDVGGHAGQYAKLFADMAPSGQVYSFEPGSYARRILRMAIAANRLSNVTVVPCGLAAECGAATLSTPIKRSRSLGFGLSHLGEDAMEHGKNRHCVTELIKLTTLDVFIENLAPRRLDFIKIDIEGWELQMLKGAEKTLRHYRPAMLIELIEQHLHRAGDTLETAWGYLSNLGYRPNSNRNGGALEPLSTPSQGDIWWLPAD